MNAYITFNQYDEIERINGLIDHATLNEDTVNYKKTFQCRSLYPTVEEMVVHNVEEHLDEYLPYLLYYYTNKIKTSDMEYKKAMKYIAQLLNEHLIFADTEKEIAELKENEGL